MKFYLQDNNIIIQNSYINIYGFCNYEIYSNTLFFKGNIVKSFNDKVKKIHDYISNVYDIPYKSLEILKLDLDYTKLISMSGKLITISKDDLVNILNSRKFVLSIKINSLDFEGNYSFKLSKIYVKYVKTSIYALYKEAGKSRKKSYDFKNSKYKILKKL